MAVYNKKGRKNMFNENLKTIRKNKGFSQEQLSVRLNVVRQTISKWEKGLSVPDAEMLVKISEILNVSVSDLLGESVAIEQNDNLSIIALELQKLNELLALRQEQKKILWKKVGSAVAVILLILLIASIYDRWNELFYDFGRSLYKLLH